MRKETEILMQAEILKHRLGKALQKRDELQNRDAEQDLLILSLLDQLETLLWVLEESPAEESRVH